MSGGNATGRTPSSRTPTSRTPRMPKLTARTSTPKDTVIGYTAKIPRSRTPRLTKLEKELG